ncbi:hypothetical protein BGZ47_010563, partial [Haplosporangium gracile]
MNVVLQQSLVCSPLVKYAYHSDNCRALKLLVGNNDAHLRSARIDNQNPHTVLNAFEVPSNNVQLQIGSNTYGNVLVPVNVDFGAAAIRVTLLNSLETGVVESMVGAPDRSHIQVPSELGHIELPTLTALLALF